LGIIRLFPFNLGSRRLIQNSRLQRGNSPKNGRTYGDWSVVTTYPQSTLINQLNLYSAHSISLLKGASDSGQAERNGLVKLRTGTVWEMPRICRKPVPDWQTNHREGTALHYSRAGE